MTNKETLDLCDVLGIGVKSHSSSIVDAQADRVRRKAEREGLVRDEQPEEPAPTKPVKKANKSSAAASAPAETEEPSAATPAEDPVAATAAAEAPAPAPEEPAPAPVAETPAEAPSAPPAAPAPAAAAPEPVETAVEAAPVAEEPEAPAKPTPRVVTSSGSARPPRPVEAVETPAVAPAPMPAPAPAQVQAPAEAPRRTPPPPPSARPVDAAARSAAPAPPATPPLSPSGKPIPPPPPPRSSTGKPIPPPPGRGGRGPAPAPPGRGARTGGAPRPGGSPGGGMSRPAGGPPPGGGGGGPRPGGGGPPGRGGPQRPQQRRRKSRRRRRTEELQPMDAPSYTPMDAPVPEGVVVIERASSPLDIGPKLNRTTADVVRFLMEQGEMVTATQSLSDDMIELFAAEVGAEIRLVDPGEEQEIELKRRLQVDPDWEVDDDAPHRPPVITVMGHVDHGKTKLLDQIRNANVVAGEAGGITQHIGAYQVEKNGQMLTFLDTPGHEAFTAMRARGAEATDIVILVVAADDGMMPQTIEALNHARAADVPIVVALNKIDRENADPQRVLAQLAERELVPEAWGGDTIVNEVSALQNIGIEELLDSLLLVSELEDLRASPEGRAQGIVLESHLDIGRGPVATVLVQHGTLRVGEPMIAGPAWGRVRALIDDQGNQVREAGPSMPVQVLGLSDVASAGDDFVVAPDEKTARDVAGTREHYQRVASIGRDASAMAGGARLEDIFSQIQSGQSATLNLIVKADVNGSLEAVTDSLRKLEREEVKLSFVHRGVGGITENDVQLASASNATILGFNVRPDRKARELAEVEHVEIRNYEIIYKLLEDIEAAMLGMLAPEYEEVVTGDAEVREIFKVPRLGSIAGCYVLNGVITRGSKVRFLRDGVIIWKGEVASLKRFKEDAREVAAGYECGIGLSDFQDLKEGDIIETFEEREIART
jgi:translation initiation factor IF-2